MSRTFGDRTPAAMMVAVPALLLCAGVVLFFRPATKVEGAPVDAYSRYRDGPVELVSTASHNPEPNGTVKDVESLDVPEGLYVIFAKGFAKVEHEGGTKLDCNLIAGKDFDHIRVGVDASEDGKAHAKRSDESAFALNVLHRFQGPGTIILKCSCDADDVYLNALKITALRVNSYLNTPQ